MTMGYRDSREYKQWLKIAQQDPTWRREQETARLREKAERAICRYHTSVGDYLIPGAILLIGLGAMTFGDYLIGQIKPKTPYLTQYLSAFHNQQLLIVSRNNDGDITYLVRGPKEDKRLITYVSTEGDLKPEIMYVGLEPSPKRDLSKDDLKPWTEIGYKFKNLRLEDIPLVDETIDVKNKFLEDLPD
ncbi:hypothetical protein J4447_04800 [Candidatus Pacearchaeota archaeon]|nr:hypothetical protein [Candidatus Pacearchaeota archaeon]